MNGMTQSTLIHDMSQQFLMDPFLMKLFLYTKIQKIHFLSFTI